MKKLFCIFSVVLILIMATVPCFALSSGFYRFSNITFGNIYYTYSDSVFSSDFPYSFDIRFNSILSPAWHNSVNVSINISNFHRYFLFFTLDTDVSIQFPQSSGGVFNFSSSVPYNILDFSSGNLNNDYFLFIVRFPSANIDYHFKNFYLLDITDLDSSLSSEQVYNYLSQFIDFSQPPPDPGVLHNRGFNNLTAFYGNLSHLFDPVWNFFDSWSFVTVFVVGSLFICMMIFVVVLIIRRCRNI